MPKSPSCFCNLIRLATLTSQTKPRKFDGLCGTWLILWRERSHITDRWAFFCTSNTTETATLGIARWTKRLICSASASWKLTGLNLSLLSFDQLQYFPLFKHATIRTQKYLLPDNTSKDQLPVLGHTTHSLYCPFDVKKKNFVHTRELLLVRHFTTEDDFRIQ